MMGLFVVVLLMLGGSLAFENERRAAAPAPGDFCYIKDHRSALVGENLYFMGGTYTIKDQWTFESRTYIANQVHLSTSPCDSG